MKLRLTDGTIIDASLLNGTSRSSSRRRENAPSKRQVKVGGGSLKRYNSRQTGRNVGGTTNLIRAIYSDIIVNPETGERVQGLPKEMCVTVDHRKKTFTWELGGSTPSPYRGGKGL